MSRILALALVATSACTSDDEPDCYANGSYWSQEGIIVGTENEANSAPWHCRIEKKDRATWRMVDSRHVNVMANGIDGARAEAWREVSRLERSDPPGMYLWTVEWCREGISPINTGACTQGFTPPGPSPTPPDGPVVGPGNPDPGDHMGDEGT